MAGEGNKDGATEGGWGPGIVGQELGGSTPPPPARGPSLSAAGCRPVMVPRLVTGGATRAVAAFAGGLVAASKRHQATARFDGVSLVVHGEPRWSGWVGPWGAPQQPCGMGISTQNTSESG